MLQWHTSCKRPRDPKSYDVCFQQCEGEIEERGLSQHDNAETLSCYELLSCRESSKFSVAMLTYGKFSCNQSCCDAGGHREVKLRLGEIWTCDWEISEFWIYKPMPKTSNVFFRKTTVLQDCIATVKWHCSIFVNCSKFLNCSSFSNCSSFNQLQLLQSAIKRWVHCIT